MTTQTLRASAALANVRHEIRGHLARRAHEGERQRCAILSLNIGNPGAVGFRTPEGIRRAMIQNLRQAEGCVHQKASFPAREAKLEVCAPAAAGPRELSWLKVVAHP